jgi:hypothetical protein
VARPLLQIGLYCSKTSLLPEFKTTHSLGTKSENGFELNTRARGPFFFPSVASETFPVSDIPATVLPVDGVKSEHRQTAEAT